MRLRLLRLRLIRVVSRLRVRHFQHVLVDAGLLTLALLEGRLPHGVGIIGRGAGLIQMGSIRAIAVGVLAPDSRLLSRARVKFIEAARTVTVGTLVEGLALVLAQKLARGLLDVCRQLAC